MLAQVAGRGLVEGQAEAVNHLLAKRPVVQGAAFHVGDPLLVVGDALVDDRQEVLRRQQVALEQHEEVLASTLD